MQVAEAIRACIASGNQSTTQTLQHVGATTGVCLPSLQRIFYRMMSDGEVKLGPGLIPAISQVDACGEAIVYSDEPPAA